MSRYFSANDVADIKNARGCNVPWDRLAGHYRATVEEVQNAVGEPQWQREPVPQDRQQKLDFDLFATDKLDEVL